MARSSSVLLLMLYIGRCISAAASLDCTESVHGSLTLLSQREGDAETVVSTVKLPSTTAHLTGQSFAGDGLTNHFVADVQHLRTVTNSEWTAGLLDGAVVVVFENSTVVRLTLDAEYCVPYQLFQHAPNSSAFVMCSNRSRVMKMEVTPAGFHLKTTPLQAEEGQKYLHVPAVPLYHPDPKFQTCAAFIHFGKTSNGEDKTWLTVVPNIETEVNSQVGIICDDTFDDGREACYTEFARIVPYNDTHFVLECRETSKSDAVRFLVQAFFKDELKEDCEGIKALGVPNGGELYVGPDRDTVAVNLGDRVSVHTNGFTQTYHCFVTQGLVQGVDFGVTADDGILLSLFTAESIFSCDSFGDVKLLSSSALLDDTFPYFMESHHLFVTQEGNSADFYSISVFDAQEGCQVQHPNGGSISTEKRPVLYLFSPEVDSPTGTPPPTQPDPDPVTTTIVTTSSSLTSSLNASGNTVVILVSIFSPLAVVALILFVISMIVVAVYCNRSHKFWLLREGRTRAPSVTISHSSAGSDPPVADTQPHSPVRYAVPVTDDSPYCMRHPAPETVQFHINMKLPIPESCEAPDPRPPIQAVDDKLRMSQTQEQIV